MEGVDQSDLDNLYGVSCNKFRHKHAMSAYMRAKTEV